MDSVLINDSVLLITSASSSNFGTGFVIHQDENTTYVLTCAHVVENAGGIEHVRIMNLNTSLGPSDLEYDLAVLKVEGLKDLKPLTLQASGKTDMPFIVMGFFRDADKKFVLQPLHGVLSDSIYLMSELQQRRVNAWNLKIEDSYSYLQKGYSGSPVFDKTQNTVFAVASHKQAHGKKGRAISIDCLAQIWPEMSHLLLPDNNHLDNNNKMDQIEYSYDIFLSYRDNRSGGFGDWVCKYFYELFDWAFQDCMGRKPIVYFAKFTADDESSVGSILEYKKELAYSRCVIPMWSPSYFELEWAIYECYVMLEREKLLGYRTIEKNQGLVLPVLVCDGEGNSFPEVARHIAQFGWFNCRDYVVVIPGVSYTEKYYQFKKMMKEWVEQVVSKAVTSENSWKKEWLDKKIFDISRPSKPKCNLPELG